MPFFFDELYASQVEPHEVDNLVWLPSPSQLFHVKSYYDVLCGGNECPHLFPWIVFGSFGFFIELLSLLGLQR
jgi:hypothetical protein